MSTVELVPDLRAPLGLPFVRLPGPLYVLLVQAGALIVGVTHARVRFVAGKVGAVQLEGRRFLQRKVLVG
jgi:hypothetical protein